MSCSFVPEEQGNAKAQLNLGMCYFSGTGIWKNARGAVKWLRKAAEHDLAAIATLAAISANDLKTAAGGAQNETIAALPEYDTDEKVQRFFTTHSNPAICSAVIDIITQPYAITIKQFTKTMVPEKNVLGKVVPKAMLIYKAKVINQMVTILSDELKDCKDNERLMEIISKLNMLNEVRRTFSKELNRITI